MLPAWSVKTKEAATLPSKQMGDLDPNSAAYSQAVLWGAWEGMGAIPTPTFTEQRKNPCPDSGRRACEAGQAQGCDRARVNWPTTAGSPLGPLPPCPAHGPDLSMQKPGSLPLPTGEVTRQQQPPQWLRGDQVFFNDRC